MNGFQPLFQYLHHFFLFWRFLSLIFQFWEHYLFPISKNRTFMFFWYIEYLYLIIQIIIHVKFHYEIHELIFSLAHSFSKTVKLMKIKSVWVKFLENIWIVINLIVKDFNNFIFFFGKDMINIKHYKSPCWYSCSFIDCVKKFGDYRLLINPIIANFL